MKAKIIIYSVKNISIAKQNQLRRNLIGHTDRSHGGKYEYRRKGLLENISHIKPNRSTIIAPEIEANKIIGLLKKYDIKLKYYNIQITKKEFEK
jgi:hypothetical protein